MGQTQCTATIQKDFDNFIIVTVRSQYERSYIRGECRCFRRHCFPALKNKMKKKGKYKYLLVYTSIISFKAYILSPLWSKFSPNELNGHSI